jgi:WD40 repeat protein
MSLATVGSLVDAIQQHRLLDPGQLEQLLGMQAAVGDPRALAKLLMERNWLTPFQLNQILSGKGQDLLLGSYVLLQRLGEGGTGQVFKARHQRMRRSVALKVIRRELLSEEEVLARFYREIRVASQVAHPHVVHAYDAGPVGNTHFLAMEYVNGIDLGKLVKESGPLPVEQAGNYICQAVIGLQHIAEHGLIHRDIKPSNLLVTPDPRPQASQPGGGRSADGESEGSQAIDPTAYPWGLIKILDLGLARFEKPLHGEFTGTYTPVGGVMMGTPDYMAPEQALDFHDTDIRSDIYSLGCTFYYLLSGQPPFPGGTLAQKLLRHQQTPPPPIEESRPDVPPRVRTVLSRLLAKEPKDRYQTPTDLGADLAAALRGDPSPALALSESAVGQAPLPADGIFSHSGVLLSAATPPAETLLPMAEVGEPIVAESAVSAIPVAPMGGESATAIAALPLTTHSGQATRRILPPPAASPSWSGKQIVWLASGSLFLIVGLVLVALMFSSNKVAGPSPTLSSNPDITANAVPPSERFAWQPKELVAVLGEHRLRHWGTATGVAYNPTGKEIISFGSDQVIRVWDATDGHERAAYPGLKSWVAPVTVGMGGKQAVSGSVDNTLRLWDTTTGKELMTFKGHATRPLAVVMSVDGKTVASASQDGIIRVWDTATGTERGSIKRDQMIGLTPPLLVLPDGKTVVTTGSPITIRLWDSATGQERVLPTGHKGFILSLTVSADGQTLASVGQDRTTRVLDVTTGKERAVVPVATTTAALSGDGQLIASPGTDGSIKIWNVVQDAREVGTIKPHLASVTGVAFSPGGRMLASSSADGTVRVWDVTTLQEAIPLQGHAAVVRHVAYSPNGRIIATSSGDRVVRVWDAATGSEKPVIRCPGEPTNEQTTLAAFFAPTSPPSIVTAYSEGRLQFWDPATGREMRANIPVPGAKKVQTAAGSPNGKFIAVATQDATIKILDAGSGRETAALHGHRGRVSTIVFTPDSQRALSAGSDGTVRIWEAPTGKQLSGFPAVGVLALSVCAHGKFLAWTSTADHAVHLWDLENPQELALLPGHTNRVTGLAFSPAAAVLISTGADGRIVVWDVESKRSLQEWQLPGPVITVAVAPDGRSFATGNSNGTAYILRLNPPAPKPSAP